MRELHLGSSKPLKTFALGRLPGGSLFETALSGNSNPKRFPIISSRVITPLNMFLKIVGAE